MVPTVVIDDNADARKTLIQLIQLINLEIRVVGEADGVQEGIQLIIDQRPKLVFLDIQMLDGTGFDLLDHIIEPDFHIIFTTAFHEFALKAFEYSAIDYLVKPISPKALIRAFKKTMLGVTIHDAKQNLEDIEQNRENQTQERIALSTQEGFVCLNLDEIIRLSSDGGYTTFFTTKGGKIVVSKNLKSFEGLLPSDQFTRPHQSHIVNVRYIQKILKEDGGCLIMQDSYRIPISRRKKEVFFEEVMRKNFL